MAVVASKQQTTALFLSTIVTCTRRHTELTQKLTNLMGNLCCAREHSVQFFAQFFLHSETAQFNLDCTGPLRPSEFSEEREIFRGERNPFFCRKFKSRTSRPGGTEIFQISSKYLKILGAKGVDIKRVLYPGPTVQNLVAWANWHR
jgi:hypothetical protein